MIFKDEIMRRYLLLPTLVMLSTAFGTTLIARAQQPGQPGQVDNPEYVRLVDQLGHLGERIVKSEQPEELFNLSLAQADALDRIIALSRPEEKDGWVRQLAESLYSAALQSPKNDLRAMTRLAALRADIDRAGPGSALAAFVGYQQLQLDHARLVETSGADAAAVQRSWRRLLANYANAYPHAVETGRALVELAALSEAAGKDEDARRCYRFMLENQPVGADLDRASGALNRLNLTGQELHLALPRLKDDMASDEPFDLTSLKGKIVVLYFWTAKGEHCAQDMRQVAGLLVTAAGQRCELVCINCDADPSEALKIGHIQPLSGIQLHERNGRVSHRFGLFELPQMMVVGKDGCVINKSVEMADLQKVVVAHLDDSVPEVIKPSSRMSSSRWLTIGK